MTDREQFDTWYWREVGDENKPVYEAAWEAWQARGAVPVKLPPHDILTRSEAVKAIQQAGYKVEGD